MASPYSTKVRASGGRHGSVRSEDGLLEQCLGFQLFDRDYRSTRLDSFGGRFQIGKTR
jgi:organic hydroperoxide reductase OsmC/OhrA